MDPPASGAPVSFLREFSFAQPGSGQARATSNQAGSSLQQQATVSGQDLALASRTCIVASKRQQGNPLLSHIRNLRWVYGDIVPDYLLGASTCALFLSLRYHLLHPEYIFVRIRELQKSFRLRVILCHVDIDDVIKPLHDITKTAMLHDCTLLCAWSVEECARYLETLKSYENKPASNIQERLDNDYVSRITGALTSIRHINKTDALTLCQSFGTLSAVLGAPMEELARCPGIGEKKVRRMHDTFHEPFRRRAPKAPRLTLNGEHSGARAAPEEAVAAGTSGGGNWQLGQVAAGRTGGEGSSPLNVLDPQQALDESVLGAPSRMEEDGPSSSACEPVVDEAVGEALQPTGMSVARTDEAASSEKRSGRRRNPPGTISASLADALGEKQSA